jgi:hypothetical protein
MPRNCYAYAVNYAEDMALDPGEFVGQKYADNSDDELIHAARADGLQWLGANWPVNAPPGYYLVALVTTTADNQNYHWIRQDAGGLWSHKPGQGNVSHSDAQERQLNAGNLPHQADFNFRAFFATSPKLRVLLHQAEMQGWALNYDHFVGYFACPMAGLQFVAPHQANQGCCKHCVIL